MPELSRFLGILIKMQYVDHPPPHFHVWYGGKKVATVRIRDLKVIKGKLPGPQLAAVQLWGYMHHRELFAAWDRAVDGLTPGKIPPLRK